MSLICLKPFRACSLPFKTNVNSLMKHIKSYLTCPFSYSFILPSITSQVALVVKNLPANAGDVRDLVLIPGSGRFPGGGHGNPLQYSCLENPMNREAWQATVHGVTNSQTQLSDEHFYYNSIVETINHYRNLYTKS